MSIALQAKATRNMTLAASRSRVSDRWLARYRTAIKRAFRQIFKEATAAALRNENLDGYVPKWAAILGRAQVPLALQMAVHGYRLAERDFRPAKAILGGLQGKQERVEWDSPWGLVEASFPDEQDAFLANKLRPQVEVWLDQTATSMAKTTRDRVGDIVQEGFEQNLTVAEIGRDMAKRLPEYGRIAADRVARTATIWNYNEGAEMRYADAGVTVKEWMVTPDDRLCDYCRPFDGVMVPMDEPFLGADTRLEAGPTAHLDIPFDIEHPPLHPNCRCVLLPVVEGMMDIESPKVEKPPEKPSEPLALPEKKPSGFATEELKSFEKDLKKLPDWSSEDASKEAYKRLLDDMRRRGVSEEQVKHFQSTIDAWAGENSKKIRTRTADWVRKSDLLQDLASHGEIDATKVYRGFEFNSVRIRNKFLKAFSVGEETGLPQLQSFTTKRSIAKKFATGRNRIGVIMEIDSGGLPMPGFDISKISWLNESEIVTPEGLRFVVTGIRLPKVEQAGSIARLMVKLIGA